jgi:hypothetical protein
MVWLARGWEDVVLTGLAELIDSGVIAHRYANIDGARVLIRGKHRGRPIVITSLGNWFGGGWKEAIAYEETTAYRKIGDDMGQLADLAGFSLMAEERIALQAIYAINGTCVALNCGNTAPTVGAQSVRLWRAWMGPRVTVSKPSKPRSRGKAANEIVQYVAPLPTRPDGSREAERHAAYALETRQFGEGLYDGKVYRYDLAAAYLLGLMTEPLPLRYERSLKRPTVDKLAESLLDHTGAALVRISSASNCYPARVHGRTALCHGDYWTWLAGSELVKALCSGDAAEIEVAHLWSAARMGKSSFDSCINIMDAAIQPEMNWLGIMFRLLYSSLVGRSAAWRKVWQPVATEHQFGRWSTWLAADRDTAEIVPHRSIAGRAEKLRDKADTSDSVPLLFAVITARVRFVMSRLIDIAGAGESLAIRCDELWTTRKGHDSMVKRANELGFTQKSVRPRSAFDRVWFSGKAVAVGERAGAKFIVGPGIPSDVAAGEDGRIGWPVVEDWNATNQPSGRRGVVVRSASASIDRIVSDNSFPFRQLPRGTKLSTIGLPAELLQPLRRVRTVDNER